MSLLDCKLAFLAPLALGVSVLAASPVLAEDAEQDQTANVVYMTSDGEELVCRTFAPTGTRIEEEYCLTEDDWDRIHEMSVEVLERLMRTGTGV